MVNQERNGIRKATDRGARSSNGRLSKRQAVHESPEKLKTKRYLMEGYADMKVQKGGSAEDAHMR